MKKNKFNLQFFSLSLLLAGLGVLFFASPASALPIFAKKYNLPCTACHIAFPKLNDFGIAFRDNGFQMGTERDTPLENPVISPFALRTTPIFTVETQTGVPTDQNSRDTISTGTFNLTGVDLLSGGVLAKNISYLLVINPLMDNGVDLESAWIRFSNLLGSSWLNVKLGKHELDIPFSEHRGFGLSNTGGVYLVNHYHPGGDSNINQFELGENEYGAELAGHDKASRIRYVIDINNGSNPASNQAVGKRPNYFTRLSIGMDQDRIGERFGLFASYGRWSTSCKTQGATTPGDCTQEGSLPGTGENTKPYSRLGGDLVLNMNPTAGSQLSISFQYLYGIDDGSLVGATSCPPLSPTVACWPPVVSSTGGSQDAVFHGGTAEINWMPGLNSLLFAHYDRVINLQQADIAMPSDYNDQTSLTFGLRYYIHISQASLVALHGEWSQLTKQKTNLITGDDQVINDYLVGVDYAF